MASQESSQNSFHTAQGSQNQNVNVAPIGANYNENLASDHDFIKLIYNIVKVSGTTNIPVFLSENITVTGGAAYCMYQAQYPSLQRMSTRDIDMVWWTLIQVDKQTIDDLIYKFRDILNPLCATIEMQRLLKEFVGKVHREPISKVEIQVSEPIHFPQEGPIINSNLHLSILIDGTHLIENICEISIHNGISSQRFNINHRSLLSNNASSPTRSAISDPIYCDLTSDYTIVLYNTRVPTIPRYIIQQLFAYKNLRIEANAITISKSHIRLGRVLELCKLTDYPYIISFIDNSLAYFVWVILNQITQVKGIKVFYLDEIEKNISDKGITLPQTFSVIAQYKSTLQGGARKTRVKKNKRARKTKKRSTR